MGQNIDVICFISSRWDTMKCPTFISLSLYLLPLSFLVGHCVMSHLHLVIPLFVASFVLGGTLCNVPPSSRYPSICYLFLSFPPKTTKPPFSIKSPPKESPFLDTKLVQKLLSIAYINVESNQFSLYILITILSHPGLFPYTFV